MAAKKPQKKNRGRTTAAAATANSITATLFGSVINMGVTAIASGSVLLCLFAAKRLTWYPPEVQTDQHGTCTFGGPIHSAIRKV